MTHFGGTLKKWHPRGFVFITPDSVGPDVFCHAQQLELAGIPTDTGILGMRVTYDVGTRHENLSPS